MDRSQITTIIFLARTLGNLATSLREYRQIDIQTTRKAKVRLNIAIAQLEVIEALIGDAEMRARTLPKNRIVRDVRVELQLALELVQQADIPAAAARNDRRYCEALEIIRNVMRDVWKTCGPRLQRFEARLLVIGGDLHRNFFGQEVVAKNYLGIVVDDIVLGAKRDVRETRFTEGIKAWQLFRVLLDAKEAGAKREDIFKVLWPPAGKQVEDNNLNQQKKKADKLLKSIGVKIECDNGAWRLVECDNNVNSNSVD